MTSFMSKRLRYGAALLATLVAAGSAAAQSPSAPYAAPAYRESASSALARHIRTLASSPRNLAALLGAGRAALAVGDSQAALAFFARAEEVAPRDGYVKAGMGSAFVQTEQPQAALRFFAEAVTAGVPAFIVAKDRGLAYDMVGDTSRAQADYAIALGQGADPEVERRLALSKAIAGDKAGALALLDPQINRRDRGAWRARAFVLALTGDTAGAMNAVRSQMPAQAAAMEPFLARLPQLSAADRAMAVHFGRFPSNLQIAAAAPVRVPYTAPSPTTAGRPDAGQTPLGTSSRVAAQIRPVPSPQQLPPAAQAPIPRYSPAPPLSTPSAPPAAAAPASPLVAAPAAAQAPGIVAADLPASAAAVAGPPAEASTAEPSTVTPPSAAPVASPAATEAPLAPLRFSDVAAAIAALPAAGPEAEAERAKAKPAPAKPAAKPAPKPAAKKAPAPPREPSRIWVQLAAAENKAAFPAEFQRIKRKAPKLLADKSAWTAPLRSTNRLLVGPFKTDKEARDLVNELSKLSISSYSWTSEAGQAVEKLPAK